MCCKSVIYQFRNEVAIKDEHIYSRIFGFGWAEGSRQAYETPGHFIDARDRVCLKCNHTLRELLDKTYYIPCLDEIPPVEEEKPPPTLEERKVTALEKLAAKDFTPNLKPLMNKMDENTGILYGAIRRRR